MMKITIHTFAMLKEMYPAKFQVEEQDHSTVDEVIGRLGKEKYQRDVLNSCRVALDTVMVDGDHVLRDGDNLYILPPSSGG